MIAVRQPLVFLAAVAVIGAALSAVAASLVPDQWQWLVNGALLAGVVVLAAIGYRAAERRVTARTAELRQEIEARERSQQSEREAAERLRAVVDNAHDAIIAIDARGLVNEFNRAAERIFGYRKDEVIGHNVSLLMPEPYKGEHDGYISNYLGTGVPKIIGRGREVEAQRKDGTVFPIDLAVAEMHVGGARGFIGVIRDVSERHQGERRIRELHAQLIHVSRLSAMGELASSLAHELNQPLTAVVNYTEACRQILDASGASVPAKSVEFLQKAAAQADRAGQIIRRLRGFVQKRPVEWEEESLSRLVEEASGLATVGAKVDGIKVTFNLAKDLPPMRLDKVQIQQVVVNLVRNAVDALQEVERRELAVETRRTNDGGQEVIVRDTGPGIPPEVSAALFRPFVTSKKEGMGIGLSISRSIIEAHGGRLWAEANQGGGTVFRFTLPAQPSQGESG
jgi:two-component system sensor kinase FixL